MGVREAVRGQPFASRLRLGQFRFRQVGGDPGGRGGNLLAKQLLANEDPAGGGRGFRRLAGGCEKRSLPENSGSNSGPSDDDHDANEDANDDHGGDNDHQGETDDDHGGGDDRSGSDSGSN